ncbi:MAG: PQQ-binding-like beta-propeller repeat protein [candidate division WOR-3 bacterium]
MNNLAISILLCQALSGWPMLHHDAMRTGRTSEVVYDPVAPPNVVWKVSIPGATPPIVGPDSSVYVCTTQGTILRIFRLNAITGGQVWVRSIASPASYPVVPALSPTGDTIYGAWCFDPAWYGHLYALNASNGSTIWEVVLPGSGSWILNPLAVDLEGKLYTGDFTNPNGMVHCINPNGTFAWSVAVPDIGGEEDLTSISIDKAREKVIVGGGNNERRLICLRGTNGGFLWNISVGLPSAPSVCIDPSTGNIYHAGASGTSYGLTTNGATLWTQNVGSSASPALSHDASTIYFGSPDGNLYALNTANGNNRWPPLAIPGAYGPAVDGEGNLVCPSSNGSLYLVDGSLGSVLWQVPVASNPLSAPACVRWGTEAWIYVTAGDTVYALTAPALEVNEGPPEFGEIGSGSHSDITCSPVSGGLVFNSKAELGIRIYSADGRLAYSGNLENGQNRISLGQGVYLWRAGQYRGKAVVR